MSRITSSKDLLMLLLYAQGPSGKKCESIRGRTRLVKMVFLFDREIRRQLKPNIVVDKAALPDFIPYDYGPFSPQIYADIEFLRDIGFIAVRQAGGTELEEEEILEYATWIEEQNSSDRIETPIQEQEFTLTKLGQEFVEQGEAGRLTDAQWKLLNEFKVRCSTASLRSLLRYVYEKYPDMTKRSKIRDQILFSNAETT